MYIWLFSGYIYRLLQVTSLPFTKFVSLNFLQGRHAFYLLLSSLLIVCGLVVHE